VSELRQKQELALTEVKKSATAFEEKRRDLASKENALSAERIGLDRIKAKKAERQEELIHLQGLLKNKRSILDQFENIKKSKEEIESLSEKADVYYQLKSKLQSILFDINTAKIRLEQDLSNLESQKRNADSCKDEFTSITQSLQTKQNEMHQLRLSVDELGDLKEDLDRAVNAEAAARAENPQLKKQMEELKQKIDELANSQTCPLCTQSINQHDHEALLNKLREEGTALGDKFRSNMKLIETTQTTVIDLRKKIAEINKNELVLREIEKAYDQLLNRKEAVLEILTLWDQEQKQQYEDIQRTLSSEEYCQDLRKELDLVGEEIKNCGYDEGLRERLEIVGEEFRNITAEMDNIRSAEAALLPLEREINTIEEQELSQNDRVEILNEEIEKLRTTIDAFSESSIDVKTAEKELIEIRDRENKLYLEVGAANQKVEILTTLAQKMEGLNSEREEIANKIESLKLLERAFGKNGVPALLIEQALPQIELKANELLEKLSGGTMSLRFVTQAAYKDDKRNDLRETLDIQISDQMGPRDYEMFSGGEAFRVNFAVRLALSEVLAQRAGARLQMLVIDEGFGSQDEMGRQRLIEAINAVRNSFEKIFVITHIESLKEAFPNRIEITKINGGSTITVC
jgi:exonuclease SbcC